MLSRKEALLEWMLQNGGSKRDARKAYRNAKIAGQNIGRKQLRDNDFKNVRDFARNLIADNLKGYPESKVEIIIPEMMLPEIGWAHDAYVDADRSIHRRVIEPDVVIAEAAGTSESPYVLRPEEYSPEVAEAEEYVRNAYNSDMLRRHSSVYNDFIPAEDRRIKVVAKEKPLSSRALDKIRWMSWL